MEEAVSKPDIDNRTVHRIISADSRDMSIIADESIDLIITSPPYPMIKMWDGVFSELSEGVRKALYRKDGTAAFHLMHAELDKVWKECFRVLKNGSFACINIGDAVRTIEGRFRLYPNHSRIVQCCTDIGFDCLPLVLWRKQTNAPNKFMGSGMLPDGAYVTLEHEFILIFRKGSKRRFDSKEEKASRMQSAFFWEERNVWFSDIWDFKGTRQDLSRENMRERSAAFPIELAWRLVNMYSLYGDTVLDPFLGSGTVAVASLATGRNSIGFDIDETMIRFTADRIEKSDQEANALVRERIKRHLDFVTFRRNSGKPLRYLNKHHGFSVMTAQEIELKLRQVSSVSSINGLNFIATYNTQRSLSDGDLLL